MYLSTLCMLAPLNIIVWLILMTVDDSFNRREACRAVSFLSFFLSFCHSSFHSRAISIVPIRTYKMITFHTFSPSLSSNIIFNRPFCGKKWGREKGAEILTVQYRCRVLSVWPARDQILTALLTIHADTSIPLDSFCAPFFCITPLPSLDYLTDRCIGFMGLYSLSM